MRLYALALSLALCAAPALAQTAPSGKSAIDGLLNALQNAPNEDAAAALEAQLRGMWIDAASPALKLLLSRGRRELSEGAPTDAIDSFDAALDLDPDLLEAWRGPRPGPPPHRRPRRRHPRHPGSPETRTPQLRRLAGPVPHRRSPRRLARRPRGLEETPRTRPPHPRRPNPPPRTHPPRHRRRRLNRKPRHPSPLPALGRGRGWVPRFNKTGVVGRMSPSRNPPTQPSACPHAGSIGEYYPTTASKAASKARISAAATLRGAASVTPKPSANACA